MASDLRRAIRDMEYHDYGTPLFDVLEALLDRIETLETERLGICDLQHAFNTNDDADDFEAHRKTHRKEASCRKWRPL